MEREQVRLFFQVLMMLVTVSFLTPASLLAQESCRELFTVARVASTGPAKAIDFVWLLHAPTSEQDRAFREKVARDERPPNPMPGGLRGLGTGEEAISFIYQNLPSFLDSVLTRHRHRFSAEELGWLAQIASVAQYKPSLKFVSGKQHPRIFTTGEGKADRVASTASTPGSDIYINTDQVNSFESRQGASMRVHAEGLKRFANKEYIAEVVSILVHELSHQIGLKDDEHRRPDTLGSKVARIFFEGTQYLSLENENLPYIGFMHSNVEAPSATGQSGHLLFYLPEHLFDFTDLISAQLEKTFERKITAHWTSSLRWEPVGQWDMVEQAQPFAASGDLIFRTEDGALHQVPVRWLVMVSHPGPLEQAYMRKRNWQNSHGFVSVGIAERQVGLQILKEKARAYSPQMRKAPSEISAIRVASAIAPGMSLSGEIELRLADGSEPKEARVIFGSDDLAFGSFFKPLRFQAEKAEIVQSNKGRALVRFEQGLRGETVRRKLKIQKILLKNSDGTEESVVPVERTIIQVNGSESRAFCKGIGVAPTEKDIKVSPTFITVDRGLMRWDVEAPVGMKLPLYADFESMGPLVRAEVLAEIHYLAADGRVKNVNAVLDLLGGRHPWLQGTRVEAGPAGQRVHFALALPKEFEGRRVRSLTLKQLHVIDRNLSEVVDNTRIYIHEKLN